MQEIQSHLLQNYTQHPAFQFGSKTWDLDEKLIEKFNHLYLTIKEVALSVSKSSTQKLQNKCFITLEEIFSSLLVQTEDKYENYFLEELQLECKRLLNEEFDWYKRPQRTDFAKIDNEEVLQNSVLLGSNRYFFSQLSSNAVSQIMETASQDIVKLRENAEAGRLKREDLSINTGRAVRAIRRILNKEFKRLGVLDNVGAYTGHKTKVTGLALELSVPQATWWQNAIHGLNRPPHTLYAHIDESIAFPKSIVYLTNVDENNGPTSCYPKAYEAMQLNPLQEIVGRVIGIVGSQAGSPLKAYYSKQYHQSVNSDNFRKHFMLLPVNMRFNSHMGWDVKPESELENNLVKLENKMIGPAGSFIIFDGAKLFHRGGLLQKGERIALQVIFSDLTLMQRICIRLKRIFS